MRNNTFLSFLKILGAVAFCIALISIWNVKAKKSQPVKTSIEITNEYTEGWPENSKKAAKSIIDKYGEPDESTKSMLIWNNTGPWKKIIVYREEVEHLFPMEHKDVLEQVIDFKVPLDKYDDLASYDGSVIIERTKGEISARCDKEAANYLALNLANDIINGERNIQDARKFYHETIMKVMKGETPEYTKKLMFEAHQNSADPDKPMMSAEEMKSMK